MPANGKAYNALGFSYSEDEHKYSLVWTFGAKRHDDTHSEIRLDLPKVETEAEFAVLLHLRAEEVFRRAAKDLASRCGRGGG